MAPKRVKLGLREKYFDLLKEGKKNADGRLFKFKNGKIYKEKYDGLKYGDILEYYKDLDNGTRTDEKFTVKVKDISFYNDVGDMLKDLKLKSILPGVRSFKKGEELYKEIYGNKLKNGVLIGIKFEKFNNNSTKNIEKKNNESRKNNSTNEVNRMKKYEERNKEIVEIKNKSNSQKTYRLYIKEPWMTLIREGFKEVEGRLYSGDVENYRIGDRIDFVHKGKNGEEKELGVEITKLVKYPDFKSLLFHEKLYRVLPGFPNIRTGNELYEKYYPYKLVKQHGALGITFKLLDKNTSNKTNKNIKNNLKKNTNEVEENDTNIQVMINTNQNSVNIQQKVVNETLKNVNNSEKNNKKLKDTEERIENNTKMLENNNKKLLNGNNLEKAEVASNQIAINANQNIVSEKQGEVIESNNRNKLNNKLIINKS